MVELVSFLDRPLRLQPYVKQTRADNDVLLTFIITIVIILIFILIEHDRNKGVNEHSEQSRI